jgi:hypothetical protein
LAKKTKKHGADQKNKQGFDSAVLNQEFAHEFGSAATNKIKKIRQKRKKFLKIMVNIMARSYGRKMPFSKGHFL